jgi:signal peptide peptidase-like protein 2B
MGGNASNITNSSAPVDQVPAAISLDRTTGQQLMEWLKDTSLTATLQRVDMSPLDASAAVLWVLAVGTLVSGSLWAGWDHALERKAAMAAAGGGGGRGGEGGAPPSEVLDITTTGAVAFVCVASAMLLLLFFFMSQAFFYFILVMFCLAGAQALTVVLLLPVQLYRPQLMARGWEVRWLGWVPAGVLLVAPVAVAVAVVFGVYRNSGWSWVLQDLLGVALMVTILRTLRLGSMKVACVLLPLCFFYDVFWVFLQPLIWHTDSSVMVTVAEGAGVNEFLPMLLRVPRFSAPPIVREYSLLGFGDVILPGLLAALTRRIDIDNSKQWVRGYFAPCVAGYGGGLLLTYAALMFSWFGDQGQPALLYLTPCTLGVVLLLGALRKELPLLFAASSTAGWEVMEDEALDEDAWQEAEAGHATHGGSRGAESRHAQRAPHQDTAGSSREEGKSLLGSQGPRSSRYDDSV